ncbi:Ribonuclease H-like superfamily protein [Rhynchospora pubera]|uniref:Ribonuclease H-like superfamily protein n=1 Tax=Rhynchospora pubera TaxID=906938 RepID=A0AAV8GDM0_9POAL|nr:Ribonuclease H-like superfamily protein [Rhynchospora pubera]
MKLTWLGGWKKNLLSHAGRLTLLKATLTAIPVYSFSVSLLNKKTINAITSLIRRFFWGKQQTKYLAPIAWHKLTTSWEGGGLAIKDLATFNKALMLKAVWAIASLKNLTWVHIINAKYCHDRGLWGTSTKRGTSQLWKDVQNIKLYIKDTVSWQVNDGNTIPVKFQPWYPGWDKPNRKPFIHNPRISDVYDATTELWNIQALQEVLSNNHIRAIQTHAKTPQLDSVIPDKLIWTYSKGGTYTAKLGYQLLLSLNPHDATLSSPINGNHWLQLWKSKQLIPRIKTFIWRALHGGLLTSKKMHSIIHSIDPICQVCGQYEDTLTHCLLQCTLPRLVWFSSPLTLRTDNLNPDFTQNFLYIIENMDDTQYSYFCCLLWLFNQQKTKKLQLPLNTAVLLLDASWDQQGNAGLAHVLYDTSGNFLSFHTTFCQAASPFHAETLAALEAMQYIHRSNHNATIIFSDCKNLVDALKEYGIVDLPCWEATHSFAELRKLITLHSNDIELQYAPREALYIPHQLANIARTKRQKLHGDFTALPTTLVNPAPVLNTHYFERFC